MVSNLDVGRKIKQYRKQHAMTQNELASKVGVRSLHITNIENGKKGVSLDTLLLICECLHVSVSDVLPEEGRNDFELRKRWMDEIVHVMDALDTARLGMVRTMVCSLLCD